MTETPRDAGFEWNAVRQVDVCANPKSIEFSPPISGKGVNDHFNILELFPSWLQLPTSGSE